MVSATPSLTNSAASRFPILVTLAPGLIVQFYKRLGRKRLISMSENATVHVPAVRTIDSSPFKKYPPEFFYSGSA